MKRNPSPLPTAIKLDIQRRHMRLERQPRRRPPRTDVVGTRIERKLTADDQAVVVGKCGGIPRGEALGIAVVAALRLIFVADQGAVIVHLFARVVLVHVEAVAHDFVGGVLDGIEAAGFGVLGQSDGIAETPSEKFFGVSFVCWK